MFVHVPTPENDCAPPRAPLPTVHAGPLVSLALVAAGPLLPGCAAAQDADADRRPRGARVSVPVPPPTSGREVAEFADSVARAALEEQPVAGVSVAVLRGSDTLVMRGWGRADLDREMPAAAGTVYRIGSITKQFTASAIMRQVEAGRLELDDPLAAHVRGFDPGTSDRPPVTVRQLLTHTSGVVDYTRLDEFPGRSGRDLGRRALLEMLGDEPLQFRPGTGHAYSNTGYYLLGMVLEDVTGRPYPAWVRDSLLAPLGLDRTGYCASRTGLRGRAEGYTRTDEGALVPDEPVDMEIHFAAGGLCSTVGDLAAWTRALHAGDVVSRASLTAMTTPVQLPDGRDTGYGFGLAVSELEGHRKIGHAGDINGFAGHVAHYPDDGLTVAVLANTRGAPVERLGERIARKALGLPQPNVLDLPLSETEARRYTGKYIVPESALPVQITLRDGRLLAQPAGQPAFELLYQGRREFRAGYDPGVRLSFGMDDGRAVGFTLRRDGRTFRAHRVRRERADVQD